VAKTAAQERQSNVTDELERRDMEKSDGGTFLGLGRLVDRAVGTGNIAGA
jgi:hypothetical protein